MAVTTNPATAQIFRLDSLEWMDMLRVGLGATVVPVGVGGDAASVLVVFDVGPFHIGYADFPVGQHAYGRAGLDTLLAAAGNAGVDVLRLHSREPLPWPGQMRVRDLGTRVIPDLQRWEARAFEKARRARNRTERSDLSIEPATSVDAARIETLYRATIDRHQGNIRYRLSYFRAIAAQTTLVARLEGQVCAFVSYACRGKDAFYLHGGYDAAFKAQYPSDLLFYVMLTHARDAGARSFDFLPSPPGQESLLRYKEAWGGQPAGFLVSDIRLRRNRGMAFEFARRIGDALPKHLLSRLLPRFF